MTLFNRLLQACLSLALLTSPALAGAPTTVVTFEGGVNQGNWFVNPPFPTYFTTGGNPDDYIGSTWDTKLPQFTSFGPSVFTGNFRMRNVTHVGVDLITQSTQMPQSRPLTFMLTSSGCSVYVVGAELAPMPGEGWKSFDFSFDPQSTTMPAGWEPSGSCTDRDVAWNTVMENVTQVAFFAGDPTLFSTYVLDQWVTGLDNARLTEENPWDDLGGATPGINGTPELLGAGLLTPNSPLTLDLYHGPPSEFALLWIALTPGPPVSAFGGTIHVLPFDDQVLLGTDVFGDFSGSTAFPVGIPSGTQVRFQFLCQDLTVLPGITLSNAVQATSP